MKKGGRHMKVTPAKGALVLLAILIGPFIIFGMVHGKDSRSTTTIAQKERKLTCYELGVKYGMCAELTRTGKICPDDFNFVMPERCRGRSDTKDGIKDGVKAVREDRTSGNY
jgi:hypothetical protein